MGFRMRKSFKVAPGVRMTMTPRGVGASVGGRAGRVSVHSSGRVTTSAGIPGTGISYVSSSGGRERRSSAGGSSRAATKPVQYASAPSAALPPKPGMFSPKWEKDLYKAATANDPQSETFVAVGTSDPKARQAAMLFDALLTALPHKDNARALDILETLYREGFDPANNAFLTKYMPRAVILTLEVTDQVTLNAPLDRDVLALTLAELRQDAGDLQGAIVVVEDSMPTTMAAVSLAELYTQAERYDDVIDLTNGMDNEDDLATYLLIQRGVAFREQRHFEASRESFKKALAPRSRPAELRHFAWVERGQTYLREGKKAMARKDFERVLAEDAKYPGLAEHLAGIGA